jgi:hypothetical protein
MNAKTNTIRAANFTTLHAVWNRLDTVEAAKTQAIKKLTAAYELIGETIVELAKDQGIKTGAATDLFLMQAKNALLDGAKEEMAFTRRWDRAVRVAFAAEGSPLVASTARKAAIAKSSTGHYAKAAETLAKAGVEQAAAKEAVLAAIAADTSGILTLNLLKVVEGFMRGEQVIRIKPEPTAKPVAAKQVVVANITPVAKAPRQRKVA